MLVDSLNDLNVHDSDLLDVIIENAESGRVTMRLVYIEDYTTLRTSPKKLVFMGCVKALMDLRFGLTAPDSLRTGHEIERSAILDELREHFEGSGIPLAPNLRHFYLETNSTASTFHIIAESVALEDTWF